MKQWTWQESLQKLKAGNQRFIQNKMKKVLNHDLESLSESQNPHAVILCCADSRISPDIIFDCSLGDLFIIQNAGNVTDVSVKGSIQYAIQYLQTPLVVVIGHTNCGAVTAAHKNKEMSGPLQSIVSLIDENVVNGTVADSIKNHAVQTAKKIRTTLEIHQDQIVQDVQIISAVYDIADGHIHWMDAKTS